MKITVGDLRRIIREEAGDSEEEVDMDKLPSGFDPLKDKPVDYNSTLYAAREEKKAKGTSARLKSLMDKLRHFRQGRRMK